MKQVWKYTFHTSTAVIPGNFKPLCVMAQGNDVCMWVQATHEDFPASKDAPYSIRRVFQAFFTGVRVKGDYVGSCITEDGLVWHVYEVTYA